MYQINIGNIYLCFFAFKCVSIVFQCALVFIIKRKIALMSDACSRPSIIIKSHDLHADNIKGPVSEITSYHERD